MKHCDNCKTDHPDSARFCPACGKPLDAPPKMEGFAFTGEAHAPTAAATQTQETLPKTIEAHLVKAIIATVCCCNPLGIAAIIYGMQVAPKLQAGDKDGAMEASKKANIWGNLAICLAVLLQILWIALSRFSSADFFFEMLKTTSFN
jgi:hypothetical protein